MFIIGDLVVISLVVFTLTVLLKDTEGPFDLFQKFKNILVGSEGHERAFFIKLFSCPWCLGTWISAVVTLLYCITSKSTFPTFIAYWLASIGITGLLYAMLYSFVKDTEDES
jgi:hypothetical protein